MDQPIVSCLCASQPKRWSFLQRAILNFQRQTYANRELIIVVGEAAYADTINTWLGTLDSRKGIRVYHRYIRLPHEALTHAQAKASGDILAVCDDDNLDHPTRLEYQVSMQLKYPNAMTALGSSFIHFVESSEVFLVDYDDPKAAVDRRCAISTLMGFRLTWPEISTQFRPHPLAKMLVNMVVRDRVRLAVLPETGLHTVGVHASNLRSYELHREIATKSQGSFPRESLLAQRGYIEELLGSYPFDQTQSTVTVHGSDFIAYEYQPVLHHPASLAPTSFDYDGVQRVQETIK